MKWLGQGRLLFVFPRYVCRFETFKKRKTKKEGVETPPVNLT